MIQGESYVKDSLEKTIQDLDRFSETWEVYLKRPKIDNNEVARSNSGNCNSAEEGGRTETKRIG